MTSQQIQLLRKNLGLTVTALATLLGVSPSTVSRWESASESEPNIDPGATALLAVLQWSWDKKQAKERRAYVDEIGRQLLVGGRLAALHFVLKDHFGD